MSDPHEALHAHLADRYELEKVLGEGGMGTVYLALDLRHERRVAIKTIRPDLTTPEVRSRFEREIKIMASLQHPHILPLLDSGTAGDTLFYIMPFVEGETLRRRMTRGDRVPVEEAVSIARDAAGALDYAHGKEVIHRDIKPENFLLTAGHALITDFGIAKALSEPDGTTVTQLGQIVGTPAYMAPEQLLGEVTPRTDIYALGCVVYEMLSGSVPLAATSPGEIAARRLREAPVPLRELRADVPPRVDEAVMRALSQDPAQRPATAGEFAASLQLADPERASLTQAASDRPEARSLPVDAPEGRLGLRAGGPWQVLGGYVLAAWIILQVAETLGSLIGLPLWFGRLLFVLLLALLPVVVLTSHVQRRRGETAPAGAGPEGAEPRTRFTWRNVAIAAGLGFAALGVGTAAHLGLRAIGVGPAASLIASGVLDRREPLVLADFDNQSPDSLLGGAVTEALRVDLSQSPAMTLMTAQEVREALGRMRRDPETPLNDALAREMARREGLKGFIVGEINPVGSAYVISVRLVATETGQELATYRETARSRGEIIEAVDRLSKRLRTKIGESLASVRQSSALPAVTTSSLEALELLSAALKLSRQGDQEGALPLLRRAAAEDTTFAMAYRALAALSYNLGKPAEGHRYAELAYRYADRLSDRERYLASAGFHASRGWADSTAYYYRLLLERWPDSNTYLNNLGDIYERMGRYQEALELYRRATEASPAHVTGYLNLASAARTLGLHATADSALEEMSQRAPVGRLHGLTDASNAMYAGDLARLDSIARAWARQADPEARAGGREVLASLAGMRGRTALALALADSAATRYLEVGSPTWATSVMHLIVNTALATEPRAAEPLLERWLPVFRSAESLRASPPFYHFALGIFATGYAAMGETGRAYALLAQMDSLVAAGDFRPSGIGEHVRALLALREGQPAEALTYLERARIADFGLVRDHSRLLLADTHAALGQLPEAVARYDTVSGTLGLNFMDTRAHPPFQPVAHERAGQVYLALGDTTAALRHLGAFIELWAEADPELQPRVQAARQTIEEILARRG